MRSNLVILITSLVITSGGTNVCDADLIVTWEDMSGELNLSIQGGWSSWDSSTGSLISTDTLLFEANGNTSFAFDLSRGNLSGVGQSVLMDIRSGSGSVSAPDFSFGAPLPTTGYNLVHLNEGGLLALEAEVVSGGTFTINESFNLGSSFTLTSGTRTFSSSTAPGDTLTMNYISNAAAVPEPSSFAILGLGGLTLAITRRRRNRKSQTSIAQ